MENKINIAELLKNCPKGMELYSPIFGELKFIEVNAINNNILVVQQNGYITEFESDGRLINCKNGECLLFPSKEKTTWEGFVPPCEFKDGDVVATTEGLWIGITTGGKKGKFIPTYCVIKYDDKFEAYLDRKESWVFNRLATEEEKQKLFNALKENGSKWNPETKTLEKLAESSEEEQVGMNELGMMWQKQALIKKACEWLENIDFASEYFYDGEGFFENAILVEEFKKAMEE